MYSLPSLYLYSILFLGLLCSGTAQLLSITNNTRIINKPVGVEILAIEVVGSASVCSQQIVYLTDSTTDCLVFTDMDGNPVSSGCDSNVRGSTHMACGIDYCFFSNPTSNSIVATDNTGAFYATVGSGTFPPPPAITPSTICVLSRFPYASAPYASHFVTVVDSTDNSMYEIYVADSFSFPYASMERVNKTFTAAPRDMSKVATIIPRVGYEDYIDKLYVSYDHGTSVSVYIVNSFSYTDLSPYGNGTFTFSDIGAMHVDYYQRVFVYDNTCSCTKIYAYPNPFNATLQVPVYIGTLTTASAPKQIRSSRNNIYVLDNQGILKYTEDPMKVTVLDVSNKKCGNRLGAVKVRTTGGAYPITLTTYPGTVKTIARTYSYLNDISDTSLDVIPPLYPAYVFNDTILGVFTYGENSVTWGTYDAAAVGQAMPEGNFSLGIQFQVPFWLMDVNFQINCYSPDCFSPSANLVELYINLGDGGQDLDICFADQYYKVLQSYHISPGAFTAHTWNKISIPLNFSTPWSQIMFKNNDPMTVSNMFYVDQIVVYPDTSLNRYYTVADFCGASYKSGTFTVTNADAMRATITTSPVTCNAAQPINGPLTYDGTATVSIENSFGDISYMWSVSSINASTAPALPSLTNHIIVYDNAINSTLWYDSSILTNGNPADSTYSHSAPYSYSMTLPASSSGLFLQFTYRGLLKPAASGGLLTFWVHGGLGGGQGITLTLLRYAAEAVKFDDIGKLMNVTTILPGVWMKATVNFYTEFNAIKLSANGNYEQSNIYFDDFEVNLTPVLSIRDAAGCIAYVRNIDVATPPPLVLTSTHTNAQCYNSTDGAMAVSVQGGKAPYVYNWQISGSPVSATGTTLDNLYESQVGVSVTDNQGCTVTQAVHKILQPPAMGLNVDIEPVQCHSGLATLKSYMYGGSAPYTYSWNSANKIDLVPTPSPIPIFTDNFIFTSESSNAAVECLGAGAHSSLNYLPSHSGYCTLRATFNTSSPSIMISGLEIDTTKIAQVSFWLYLESAVDAQNLQVSLRKAGASVSTPVAVRDLAWTTIAANSWNQISLNLSGSSDPNPDELVFTSSTPTSMGRVLLDDISLIPNVVSSVGISVYGGFKSVVVGNAGLYFLTVVDANGCSFLKTINVSEPGELVIVPTISGASSTNATDGSVKLGATGGTPPYKFLWLATNTTSDTASGLAYGSHEVQVTDANGCTHASTIFVTLDDSLKLRAFNKGLSSGMSVVAAVGIAVCLFAIAMMVKFREVGKLGSVFNSVVVFGVLVACISVVMLLPDPTDNLCTAYPWLLGVGFTLVYSLVFLKLWTIFRVWSKAKTYTADISASKVIRTIVMALLVEFALLAVWTAIDRPQVRQVRVVNDTLEEQCTVKQNTFWTIFVAMKGAWLLAGTILSFVTRSVLKEYNESSVAYATYNLLVLTVIAIPLGVLLDEVPGGRLVIEIVIPVIAFSATLVILFFKNWHTALFGTAMEVKMPGMKNPSGGSGPSNGSSETAKSTGMSKGSKTSSERSKDSSSDMTITVKGEENSSALYPL